MSKKMLALSLVTMLATGVASAQNMKDPYKGTKSCPDSESFEYVGATLFGFDKSNPSSLEMSALDRGYERAAAKWNGNNYVWVQIKGTTDSVGTTGYNDRLGQARAEAVKQSLLASGAKEEMVHVKSFGERVPKYSNSTAEGRQLNRAAHVSIVSMDKKMADWCYANHPESVPKAAWWTLS